MTVVSQNTFRCGFVRPEPRDGSTGSRSERPQDGARVRALACARARGACARAVGTALAFAHGLLDLSALDERGHRCAARSRGGGAVGVECREEKQRLAPRAPTTARLDRSLIGRARKASSACERR
eukprot:16221-Pleurochrysis_carterae.AAC.2